MIYHYNPQPLAQSNIADYQQAYLTIEKLKYHQPWQQNTLQEYIAAKLQPSTPVPIF
jgi:hypothetical protein